MAMAFQAVVLVTLCTLSLLNDVQGARLRSLEKRSTSVTSGTLDIPLTINQDLKYIAGVNMSSGPNTQQFKFALVGNTGMTAVAGTACDDCNNVPSYNQTASVSASSLSGFRNISLGMGSISGPLVKENCGLHQNNGSVWQYPNQTVIVANTSTLFSGDSSTSGLIGLGTNANGATGPFTDTFYGQFFIRNPLLSNFSFGMALKKPVYTSDNDVGNGGTLHWLQPDKSAYTGNVSWVNPNVAATAPDATFGGTSGASPNGQSTDNVPESDWAVPMSGWTATVGSATVSNSSSTSAVIEPWYPYIMFPFSQANLLYASVPNATLQSSLVGGAQVWSIPCDSQFSVGFNFGQHFVLDQNSLVVQQGNSSCIGVVQAWASTTNDFFLLGGSFISEFYLIFVVGNPANNGTNSLGFAKRSSGSSSSHVGAIVGGVVGGVLGLAAVVIAGVFVYLYHKRTRPVPVTSRIASGEKLDSDADPDKDGAQYANRPYSQATVSAFGPSPPPSASMFSAADHRAFLPEPQAPDTPALSVPGSPHSGRAMIITSGPSSSPHDPRSSVAMSVTPSVPIRSSTIDQNMTVDPFLIPLSAPPAPRSPKSAPAVEESENEEASFPQNVTSSEPDGSAPPPAYSPPEGPVRGINDTGTAKTSQS